MHALLISVGGDVAAAAAVVVKCYNLTIKCCTNVHSTQKMYATPNYIIASNGQRTQEKQKLRSKWNIAWVWCRFCQRLIPYLPFALLCSWVGESLGGADLTTAGHPAQRCDKAYQTAIAVVLVLHALIQVLIKSLAHYSISQLGEAELREYNFGISTVRSNDSLKICV